MSLRYQLLRHLSDLVVGISNYAIFYLFFAGGSLFSLAQSYYIWTFDSQLRQKDSSIQGKVVDWENPEVVGRKRVPMHSSFKNFSRKSSAKTAFLDSSEGDNMLMLTGPPGIADSSMVWKFALVGDPDSLDTEWIRSGPESSKYTWSDVSLPGHWQLSGFDIPIYTNTSYPFRFNPPYVRRDGTWVNAACDLGLGAVSIDKAPLHPKEPGYNATGLYYRSFVLPSSWLRKSKASGEHIAEDSQVFLVFEGADSSLAVWVNGVFVGYGQDSCLSSEFDVTQALREHAGAEHRVAVRVTRWCDGSYLEDQDKWWLSGIYREVYLIKKSLSRIFDYEVRQEVDLTTAQVTAKIDVDVIVEGVLDGRHAVRLELYDFSSTEPIATQVATIASGDAFSGRMAADAVCESACADLDPYQLNLPGLVTLSCTLPNPTLWSAEKPHLYQVILTLYSTAQDANEGGEGLHSVTSRIGIKQVSIGGADHVLMVNGKPITIAGVNRHEFEPYTGRATSRQCMLEDAKVLKRMNFNAVRSAHYPQHPYWLEVCDEVGLYMIDEANIETHGFQVLGQPVGYLSNLPEWRGALLARVARMYERDKNHACVIGWSLGNESGFGTSHALMKQWLDARDKSRFVQYESGGARTVATDIICPMYQRPKWCLEQSSTDPKRRPVILCEYAHAMGNSGGCLSKYWQVFRDHKHPRIQGGFIWDLVDQGLKVHGKEGYHYGGDFGDLPNTHHFCCNGLLAPDRSLYPGMFEARHLQCPVHVELECSVTDSLNMVVHNLRDFEDLTDVVVRVKVCYLPPGSINAISSPAFEIDCDGIQSYRSKHFEIINEVNGGTRALLGSIGSASTEWPVSFRTAVAPTAWLDVSIVMLGSANSWSHSEVEIDHTTLQHSHLQTVVQDALSVASALPQESEDMKAVNVEDSPSQLAITWPNGSSAVLDKQRGVISSWKDSNNAELLIHPLDLCFYRAPTDNDKGGDLLSYAAQWKDAGYQDLQRSPNHKCEVVFSRVVGGGVWVVAKWVLTPSAATRRHDVGIEIACTANYTFLSDGSIDIDMKAQVPSYLPPLPRFGISGSLSADFSKVRWFGKGPHEAYDDRRTSAYLSVFHSTVSDLHTPYMRPQENGRRADVAWVMFENNAGSKIMMVPNCSHLPGDVDTLERYYHTHVQGYGFSASRYSIAQLIEARHDHELVADDSCVYVNFDSRMMGIGGYDSWSPNVDDEFLIKPAGKPLEVKVRLYSTSPGSHTNA